MPRTDDVTLSHHTGGATERRSQFAAESRNFARWPKKTNPPRTQRSRRTRKQTTSFAPRNDRSIDCTRNRAAPARDLWTASFRGPKSERNGTRKSLSIHRCCGYRTLVNAVHCGWDDAHVGRNRLQRRQARTEWEQAGNVLFNSARAELLTAVKAGLHMPACQTSTVRRRVSFRC